MNDGRTGMNGNNVNKKYIRKDHKKNDRRSSAVRNRSSLAKSLCTVRELVVIREAAPGYYLGENEAAGKDDQVLLPGREVTSALMPGSRVKVFLYLDSEDRLTATEKMPLIMKDRVAALLVRDVGKIGAFLDWGLDKDLLLPYHEQPRERVKEGQTVLVAVYLDKSERLCATMNVYPWLRTDSPYKAGDQVSGVVYETSRNFGAFVAVDSIYSALIPRRELVRELKAGEVVQARVTSIKPDGKIDLSIREKGYLQIDADVEAILNMLNEGGGMIPFTDKAAPELIREKTHMSKNEFKRAVGHLLKENKISIEDDRIVLL